MSVTPTYEGGTNASDLEYDVNATYGMVEKIARQIIKDVSADNPLAVFQKMPIENGTTIEEVVIKMAERGAWTRDGSDIFKKTAPSLAVKYYKDWTSAQYAVTQDDNETRKVLLANGNVSDIASKVVQSLVSGDTYDHYTDVKGLLSYGASNSLLVNGGSVARNDYKAILELLKNTISGMKFVNDVYNVAQIKRKTFANDIYILMPYDIKNAISVRELSGVFNLSEDELDAHIIELDNLSDKKIYVVDKQAILDYTRLYKVTSQYNPKALYMNYWLTMERLYALSPLFDACYITLTDASGQLPLNVEVTNSALDVEVVNTTLDVEVVNTTLDVEVVNTEESPVNTKEVTG